MLEESQKQFSIKNGQLYYKESRLVIASKDRHVGIIHDIQKRQVILVTQKQCQLILGEPLHTKKLLHVSSGMGFKTTLWTT